MTRVSKAPDERRNELILTAQHLFFTKGYESTSVNDIVKAVGVAKGTFYHYFETKTAVLEALVDTLIGESITLMQKIVDDPTLPTLEKWHTLFDVLGSWKLDRKTEMLELMRFMARDENVLLTKKIQDKTINLATIEIGKIIQQGIDEGVFKTEFAEETAAVILSLNLGIRESMMPLFLNPEQYNDPVGILKRKYTAIQTAMERILDAPPGSMRFVDEESIVAWFEWRLKDGEWEGDRVTR